MPKHRGSIAKRREWNRKCREKLSSHLQTILGIEVSPTRVRLKTKEDDPYIWDRPGSKEHLFSKNMSDHSIKCLKELYDSVGECITATRNKSEPGTSVRPGQNNYDSFTVDSRLCFAAKADELCEGIAALSAELESWKSLANSESEARRKAEEVTNHLRLLVKQAQDDNRKLERYINEWKTMGEKERGDVTKYHSGMSKIFTLMEDLKTEFSPESKDAQEDSPLMFEDDIFEPREAPLPVLPRNCIRSSHASLIPGISSDSQ